MAPGGPIIRSLIHASPLHKLHFTICLITFYFYVFAPLPWELVIKSIWLGLLITFGPVFHFLVVLSILFWYRTILPFPLYEFFEQLHATGTWTVFHFPSNTPRTITDERNRMLYYLCNGLVSVSKMFQAYRMWNLLIAPLWNGLEAYTVHCGGWGDKGSLVRWVVVGVLMVVGVVLELFWQLVLWVPWSAIFVNQYFILVEGEEKMSSARMGSLAEKGDMQMGGD